MIAAATLCSSDKEDSHLAATFKKEDAVQVANENNASKTSEKDVTRHDAKRRKVKHKEDMPTKENTNDVEAIEIKQEVKSPMESSNSASHDPPNGEVMQEHVGKKEIPLNQATQENSSSGKINSKSAAVVVQHSKQRQNDISIKEINRGKHTLEQGCQSAEAVNIDTSQEPTTETDWNVIYNLLVQYKNSHGNCLVPKKYQGEKKHKSDCNLPAWVRKQRKDRKSLSMDQLSKLQMIGFDFNHAQINGQNEAEWDVMYNRLIQYKKFYGNCLVPKKYQGEKTHKNDCNLGTWVSKQRRNYKSLSMDHLSKLELLGFDFIGGTENKEGKKYWQIMYNRLVQYKSVNGNCLVPEKYEGEKKDKNEPNLGWWVKNQRKKHKLLSGYQSTKLESIGFDFGTEPSTEPSFNYEPNTQNWDMMYDRLVQYKDKHGDCSLFKEGREQKKFEKKYESLFQWAAMQRLRRRLLSEDQVSKLKSVGFVFGRWDYMYEKLVKYKEQNGHCLVSETKDPLLAK